MAGTSVATARAPESANGAEPPTRTIRTRTALPAGRAVVGGFLVVLAATAVFVSYTRATTDPQERFVVARRTLAPGTSLAPADLTLSPMRLTGSIGFRSVEPLIGATVLGPIGRGELVQPNAVLAGRGRPTERELSIPIDSARAVSGDLRPGDLVDVAATFGSGADAYTLFVVRKALVLSRDQSGGSLSGNSAEVLVVSLPQASDALAVAHAISVGQLTVVRATGADAAGPDPYRAPAAPVVDEAS